MLICDSLNPDETVRMHCSDAVKERTMSPNNEGRDSLDTELGTLTIPIETSMLATQKGKRPSVQKRKPLRVCALRAQS